VSAPEFPAEGMSTIAAARHDDVINSVPIAGTHTQVPV
jgi:hypothetical protein